MPSADAPMISIGTCTLLAKRYCPGPVPGTAFFVMYSGNGLSGRPCGGAPTSMKFIGMRTLPACLRLAASRTSLLSAVDASARILPISATSAGGVWPACAAGVAAPIGATPGTSGGEAGG